MQRLVKTLGILPATVALMLMAPAPVADAGTPVKPAHARVVAATIEYTGGLRG